LAGANVLGSKAGTRDRREPFRKIFPGPKSLILAGLRSSRGTTHIGALAILIAVPGY
jgi:hypothetical protein